MIFVRSFGNCFFPVDTAPTGAVAARAEPEATPANECSITPGAGYRNLYNQLYRLEIHQPGDQTTATFKWSRDNGTVLAHWLSQDGDDLTVETQGRDPYRLFQPGGWIELIDRERELREEPGTLVQLLNVRDNVLTIDPATATGPVDAASFKTLPRVRRWDSPGALPLNHAPNADGFSPIEFGVQCRFADGTYRSADYWLIPARTATGDIEWPEDPVTGEPSLLPREGIQHHLARLALLSFDGTTWTVISDCRKLFPPITEPRDCDLKLHNKHLHGKGVVCGLAVHCGGTDSVMVLPGHAIDCEGTDILVPKPTSVPVVALAIQQELLDANGNGDVLLTLQAATDDSPVFGVRAAPDQPEGLKEILEHILEGTLWWDFYHDCLEPLVDFLRKQLFDNAAAPAGTLVSTPKKRLVTLANLLAHQRAHPPSRRLWLSLEQHNLLQELYDGLVAFAGSSHTFCGMLREFPAFPAYPFGNRPMRTAFAGRRLHGIRMVPDGRRALAWSQEEPGRLFVLDAETSEFLQALDLPNAAASAVRDVTFATNEAGSPQVLVLATAGNNTQIHLLAGSDFKPSQPPIQLAGGLLTRAEMHPLRTTVLIAVEPGQGVHFFDLNELDSGSMPKAVWAFAATGHLAVEGNRIAATATLSTAPTAGTYDALFLGTLLRRGTDSLNREPIRISNLDTRFASGSDGLALAPSGSSIWVHLVVNPAIGQVQKSVLIFDAAAPQVTGVRTLPLADDDNTSTGPVRLLADPAGSRVLFALERRNQLFWSSAAPGTQPITATLPAQAQPVALAVSTDRYLVAHAEGATVVTAPLSQIQGAVITDAQLAAYRSSVLNAFASLLVPLLQGLKDCLCDKLLVRCPECGEDEYLPLARIEIRAGAVHHICNRIRQEVLTFPKVTYWLSAIPILPLVDFLVAKFCCWILPTLPTSNPSNFTAAGASPNSLAVEAMIAFAQSDKPAEWLELSSNQFSRAKSFSRLGAEKSIQSLRQPTGTAATKSGALKILEQPSERVVTDLSNAGIQVNRIADYRELLAEGEALPGWSAQPASLKAGDRVEIFTRGNQVLFYRKLNRDADQPTHAPAPAPDTTPGSTTMPPAEAAAWLPELRELQSEVSLLKARNQTLLTESQAELAQSQAALAQLRKENEELRSSFQKELQEVRATTAKDRDTLARLETEWKRLAATPTRPPITDVTDITRPTPTRARKRAKPGPDSPKP